MYLRHSIDALEAQGKHQRIVALDGLRGILAAIVVLCHAITPAGSNMLEKPAQAAVWIFWVLSGFVMVRRWDGRLFPFMARRIVRLWPVHLACLGLAWAIAGASIHARDVLLFPWISCPNPADMVQKLANPPSWSLCVEVAASLCVPALAWCGRNRVFGLIVGLAVSLALSSFVLPVCLALVFFVQGAALSRVAGTPGADSGRRFALAWVLECGPLQWLGRISYSLYLAHGPVFRAAVAHLGPLGTFAVLPAVLGVSWLVWLVVEKPSTRLARRIK